MQTANIVYYRIPARILIENEAEGKGIFSLEYLQCKIEQLNSGDCRIYETFESAITLTPLERFPARPFVIFEVSRQDPTGKTTIGDILGVHCQSVYGKYLFFENLNSHSKSVKPL